MNGFSLQRKIGTAACACAILCSSIEPVRGAPDGKTYTGETMAAAGLVIYGLSYQTALTKSKGSEKEAEAVMSATANNRLALDLMRNLVIFYVAGAYDEQGTTIQWAPQWRAQFENFRGCWNQLIATPAVNNAPAASADNGSGTGNANSGGAKTVGTGNAGAGTSGAGPKGSGKGRKSGAAGGSQSGRGASAAALSGVRTELAASGFTIDTAITPPPATPLPPGSTPAATPVPTPTPSATPTPLSAFKEPTCDALFADLIDPAIAGPVTRFDTFVPAAAGNDSLKYLNARVDVIDLATAVSASSLFQQTLDQNVGSHMIDNYLRSQFLEYGGEALIEQIKPPPNPTGVQGSAQSQGAFDLASTLKTLITSCATTFAALDCAAAFQPIEQQLESTQKMHDACSWNRRAWMPTFTAIRLARSRIIKETREIAKANYALLAAPAPRPFLMKRDSDEARALYRLYRRDFDFGTPPGC